MAKLELHYANVKLGASERATILRDLQSLTRSQSRQRLKELNDRFSRHARARTLIDRVLQRVGADFSPFRKSIRQEFVELDGNRRRAARRLVRLAPRGGGRKRAVWGLSSGVDVPTYDFSWTYHDVSGSPLAGNMTHIANPSTGYLYAYAHAHDSSPRMVNSYAGVGFWYIPNRTGILGISIAPPLHETMWTGADWDDVGAAGGWITLGIAAYLRSPFRFDGWRIIDTDQLWWNEDNWFDWTDHFRDRSAYGMSVNTQVDTAHYYACWSWVEAYAYARNGGSYAGSGVQATIPGFTYSLT